ncbi:MAG: DUF1080 domain-containing protein, partial [Planctomycetota bacterium]|nr:DUF1080 domain-containing protein [Planctomycetota bacterium]
MDAYRLTTFRQQDVPKADVVTRGGKKLLHLNHDSHSWTTATLKDRTFKNFTAEVKVKKPNARQGYAGLIFRQRLKVFFRQKGRVHFTSERKHNRSMGESVDGFDIEKYRTLRIVCIGPLVRVYVDGRVILENSDSELDCEGPIGFTTHITNAYFDDLKISLKVPPEEAILVEPRAEDNALVFAPDKPATLKLSVNNFSKVEQKVTCGMEVKTWDNRVLSPNQTKEVTSRPNTEGIVEMKLGTMPEGYYKLVVVSRVAGRELSRNEYPLAVHVRETVEFSKPIIPLAPYWKYGVANMKPLMKNTYMHAAGHSLRKHHFNAIVAGVDIDQAQVDVLKEYGIAVITRGVRCIQSPSVIGGLLADEPHEDNMPELKQQYADYGKQTDKPLTTCMIGEGILSAVRYWDQLQPKVRTFRWYGLKKNYYNLMNRLVYKNVLSFVETLVIAGTSHPTPYWVVLPSFGQTNVGAYYCNPMPSELEAMMHLCMAYGCEGLLFFSYQPQSDRLLGLVEAVSLAPSDGKYAAAAKVNAQIERHGALLKTLKSRAIDARCDNYAVEVVGLAARKPDEEERAAGGKIRNTYVYAINKDNAKTVSCRVFNIDPAAKITCLYTGEDFKPTKETVQLRPGVSYETGVVRLTLKPGEGRLLKHHQSWQPPPPLDYPARVTSTPPEKTLWLIDLKPANSPKPGWMPPKKGTWK